jgi:hypothetical protein
MPPAAAETVRPRVLVVVFNPTCRSAGGRPLTEVLGWNDPLALTRGYVEDLSEVSGGYLRYEVVETLELDEFPRKADGFRYDEATYLRCWRSGQGFHQPDGVDYRAILRRVGMVERVEAGELDELGNPPWSATRPTSATRTRWPACAARGASW